MDAQLLLEKIQVLPAKLQQEVEHFIGFLVTQKDKVTEQRPIQSGLLKGKKIRMSEDFDSPLDWHRVSTQ